MGAVPAPGRRGGNGRGGLVLLQRASGGGPVGSDGALLRDGPVEVVQVLVGDRGGLGPGNTDRGAGLRPLAAGWRQTSAATLAQPGPVRPRRYRPRREGQRVRGLGAGAYRDGVARLLRLPPRYRHRTDSQ